VSSLTPRSTSETLGDSSTRKSADKDYFAVSRSSSDKKSDSATSTPHIAFQEKGRQPSSDYESAGPLKPPMRKLSKTRQEQNGLLSSSAAVDDDRPGKLPSKAQTDDFKLQEAPKSKRLIASRSPSTSSTSQDSGAAKGPNGTVRKDSLTPLPGPDSASSLNTSDKSTPRSSQESRKREDDVVGRPDGPAPSRSDPAVPKAIARKEVPSSAAKNGTCNLCLTSIRS
jgi:hypothetical protein